MTREDVEKTIMEKLDELRKLIYAYDPEMPIVCLAIGKKWLSAFAIADIDGENERYLLNIEKSIKEEA